MKKYADLTKHERAILSREGLTNLLNIELMENGLVRPEKPIYVDICDMPKPTPCGLLYQVKTGNSVLTFDTMEKAQAVQNLGPIATSLEYFRNYSYNLSYVSQNQTITIEILDLYKYETLMAYKALDKDNVKLLEANKKQLEIYENTMRRILEIEEPILEDWEICKDRLSLQEDTLKVWDRYLTMSEGSEIAAANFLRLWVQQLSISITADVWIGNAFLEADREHRDIPEPFITGYFADQTIEPLPDLGE